MNEANTIAKQLAELAGDEVAELCHRDAAHDALIRLCGKAEVARRALQQVDAERGEMTIPLTQGLIAILEEIGDDAWHVARIQFADVWKERFA